MAIESYLKEGSLATSTTGNSQFKVYCNYTVETDSSTGIKTVTYYYYLEVITGNFYGTPGYVSWNPNVTWSLNGVEQYQRSGTYTLTVKPGESGKSIPSASGGYAEPYDININRSTLAAIPIDSIPLYTNTISHLVCGFKNNEGNYDDGSVYKLEDTTFTAPLGTSYVLNNSRAVTIPNGFYLNDTFGIESVSGEFNSYDIGITITQEDCNMHYEYYYYPHLYNIEYDLNGGINNSENPDTYDVLYGVALHEPTKVGYKFIGWKDNNGNAVTGINENVNATFESDDDLYSELEARTTGDIVLTANWKPINIVYGKRDNEWKLYNIYIKVDGKWESAIMYQKVNEEYKQCIV